MKKIIYSTAIAIMGLATITGCTKKSDSTPTYSMKATINGVAFNGTGCYAGSGSGSLLISGGIGASSTTLSYPYIVLSVNTGYTGVGTYVFNSIANIAQVDSAAGSGAIGSYGTITITNTNPLTGTFSFTCSDSTKVTGGSFVAKTN